MPYIVQHCLYSMCPPHICTSWLLLPLYTAASNNYTRTLILKDDTGIVVSLPGALSLSVRLTESTSSVFCTLIMKWFWSSVFCVWGFGAMRMIYPSWQACFFCLFINWRVYRAHSFGTAVCICLLVTQLIYLFILILNRGNSLYAAGETLTGSSFYLRHEGNGVWLYKSSLIKKAQQYLQ